MNRTSIRIACLVGVVFAAKAGANVGPPNIGGRIAGDPIGIRDVAVERSSLILDLRPLAANGLVRIEATYHLNNAGAERRLDLLLTAGPNVDEYRLTLDDRPLTPNRRLQKGENTDGWMAPRETPRIEGRGRHGSLMYRPRVPAVLEFSVSIPPGRHILRANYECEAGTHLFGDPTVYRQFGYVLSPAHTWTNFSGMDVTVHIPEGWHVSTNLALTQDGDKWSGRFEGVPADSLAITIQAPESSSFATVTYGAQALLLISVILGLVVAWWLGRRLGRRAASADVHARGYWGRHAWPWSAVFGLSWALVVAVTGTLAVYAPDWSLPSGQASHYGYGQAFATIGVVLLAVILAPIGFIITQVVAVVVASSARPSRTPRHVDQAV